MDQFLIFHIMKIIYIIVIKIHNYYFKKVDQYNYNINENISLN